MYYQDILHSSKEYGDGERVVLLVGTRSNGITFGGEEAADIFQELSEDNISGLSIAGNEPLTNKNIPLLVELCKACKEDYSDKTIWCYTKFLYEDIKNCKVLKYIDVLIDGKEQIIHIK